MSKVYKSKIGVELVIPLIIVFGTLLFLVLSDKPSWSGLAILLAVIFFIIHLFMTTYYEINGHRLTIRCGFLFNKTIDINSIKKLSETNNPFSSPATSMDRIEISYSEYDSVVISPKEKKEFINNIQSLNPSVEVQYKNK